jgi:hypothetical protein
MPGIHAPAQNRSGPPAVAAEAWEPDVEGAWEAAGVLEVEPGGELAEEDDVLFSMDAAEH